MSLTPEGNLYLSGAKAMLAVKNQALEKIRSLEQDRNQVISIALNRNFHTFFRTYIESEFENRFPYIGLQPVLVAGHLRGRRRC